ncbi:MAG: response regulator transcription factor [Solirubrobacteraceae bacterium]
MRPVPSTIPDGAIQPLIVDEHIGSRLGLGVLLKGEPWVGRCLLARDVREGAELAQRHRPQVALLDVSNAGPFVASAIAALHEAHPPMQIVLMSRCSRNPSAPQPDKLDVADFLPSDAPAETIVAAVHGAVMSLERPPQARRTRSRPTAPAAQLTERERLLLELISTGATNREIASRLHLGPDSVKKSASTLYRKLEVRNRTEAAQRAAELLAAVHRGSTRGTD